MAPAPHPVIWHATAVIIGDDGVLITGAAGRGKSSLALALMTRGAALISDDRVILTPRGAEIEMTAPAAIRGLLEARGLGLLRAETRESALLRLAVDLDTTENERLPPPRGITILGQRVPLLRKVESPAFPDALMQYVRHGREG